MPHTHVLFLNSIEIILLFPKYFCNYFSAERERMCSPMGHYVSTYYKTTYQKDYNTSSSQNYRSYSPGDSNPFYTTVTGRSPSPD